MRIRLKNFEIPFFFLHAYNGAFGGLAFIQQKFKFLNSNELHVRECLTYLTVLEECPGMSDSCRGIA